jgi:hypothetical protein
MTKRKIDFNKLRGKPYSRWPDRALISEYQGLHRTIFVSDCFATHDLYAYEEIQDILEGRGYEITTGSPEIRKGNT